MSPVSELDQLAQILETEGMALRLRIDSTEGGVLGELQVVSVPGSKPEVTVCVEAQARSAELALDLLLNAVNAGALTQARSLRAERTSQATEAKP